MPGIAGMPGEELRQPVKVEQRRGLELSAAEALEMFVQAVAHEPECKAAVLDRPDRSTVIAVGVVGRMIARQRAHAPATVEIVLEEAIGGRLHVVLIDNARGETVTGIRSDRRDLARAVFEAHREKLLILHPERVV